MRKTLIFFILISFLGSCKENHKIPKEILIAKDQFDDFFKYQYSLKLFSDSTYIFTISESEWAHEKTEIYRGRYFNNRDTIYFKPFRFEFSASNKAVLKDDLLE
jgi:hypothetical protein